MSGNGLKVRLAMAALLILFGLIIVGRGLIQAAPLQFTALGGLLVALGCIRFREVRAVMRHPARGRR